MGRRKEPQRPERALGVDRRSSTRLRSGLLRHGLIPRPAELRRLLRASDLRFAPDNAIRLFREGREALDAMLAAIANARRRVHLETYILRTDATGRRFIAALAARARSGVEVRVLYDAVGSRGIDHAALDPLRDAGADVTAFNPLRKFYPHWAPRRRDHRKILVVDGDVAFTGGLNIGDEYAVGRNSVVRGHVAWWDAHLRVEGPAVQLIEAVFLESWFRADGPDRPWLDLGRPPAPRGETAVGVLADGPTYHRRRMRELLVGSLARTRRRARFATPYFVPGAAMRDALCEAAARGVEVEVLVAGYSDHPILRWAARGAVLPLLDRGVRVFECERAMMHAKVSVLDDHIAIVGTSNLDRQSLQHSYEINLVLEGGTLCGELGELIDADLVEATELSPSTLAARPRLERWRDAAAARLVALAN